MLVNHPTLPHMPGLLLARPPTTNQLYAISWERKRRFLTKVYKEWRSEASKAMRKNLHHVAGPADVRIYAAVDHKLDIDNLVKPVGDALVDAERVRNDRWINHAEVWRIDPELLPQDMIVVTLRPWSAPLFMEPFEALIEKV